MPTETTDSHPVPATAPAALLAPARLVVPLLLGLGVAAAFLREILFADAFGTSHEIEVFRLAYSLPNLLSQSVAPAFAGAVIPLLVAAESQGRAPWAETARRILNVNIVGAMAIAVAGSLLARPLAAALAPGFAPGQLDYLAGQVRLGWLFFLLLAASFGLRAMLNVREVYFPSASAGLVVSVAFIVGILVAGDALDAGQGTSGDLMVMAIAGAAVVLLMHAMHKDNLVLGYLGAWRKHRSQHSTTYRVIVAALSGVVVYKVSYAIPRIIDRAVATDLGAGTVASLDYSFGILNVPGILMATTVTTLVFPHFARLVSGKFQSYQLRRYVLGLALLFAAGSIAGVVLSLLAPQIVSLVYERGAFDASATSTTAALFYWHSLGLGAMVACLVMSQALFAFRAYAIALAIVALRVVAKLIAIKLLVPAYGIAGLGASFIVPELVTLAGLYVALHVIAARRSG